MSRRGIRIALIILGLAFAVPLVFFDYTSQGNGPDDRRNTLTIGLPLSPWLRYEETTVKQEWGEGMTKSFTTSTNSNWDVEFISVSTLCFVLSVTLLILSGVLKGEGTPGEPANSAPL
jgi:hypothetical protein